MAVTDKIRREVDSLRTLRIRPEEFCATLAAFGHQWEHLTSARRARLLRRLIERINYQPGSDQQGAGQLTITFSPAAIHSLAAQQAPPGGASS